MTQKITVLKSAVTTPEGKKYKICELGYKTEDGKVKGMRIFGFGDQKEIFDVAAASTKGDVLEANFRQNAKGYWEFSDLQITGEKALVADEATPLASKSSGVAKGNWETSEERAARQVMIVRQSSLSNAVAFAEVAKLKPAVEDIIKIAKQLEAYVLGKEGKPEVTGEVQ